MNGYEGVRLRLEQARKDLQVEIEHEDDRDQLDKGYDALASAQRAIRLVGQMEADA